MSALLEVDAISAGYGGAEIIHEVSLRVDTGQIATIIGPNGAGKSTLLKAIFGLLRPSAGLVRFRERDVTRLAAPKMVAAGAAFVPQTENIFPSLSVRENLEMGGYSRRDGTQKRISDILALFPDLASRPSERASRLSGGQRQMLAMARALMLDPVLLLVDEPTASLAPLMRREILDRIRAINGEGVAVLMVEQNAKEALAMSHHGYVLVGGCNALEQSGAELLANPDVGRLFLGQEIAVSRNADTAT